MTLLILFDYPPFNLSLTNPTLTQIALSVVCFNLLGWNSVTGLSSLGVPGVPWHTQILADQLTLFQPGGTDYAHLITTGTPRFSDLPTALYFKFIQQEVF